MTALIAFFIVAFGLAVGDGIYYGWPGRAIARRAIARIPPPPPPADGPCPGVAMPTGHSLTQSYSRPLRRLLRYQVTDRCWHCDYARPYPPQGWRARRVPSAALSADWRARYPARPAALRHHASGPVARWEPVPVTVGPAGPPEPGSAFYRACRNEQPRCAACGRPRKSCAWCTRRWLCPSCRHGNHGCEPGDCRAPAICKLTAAEWPVQ